MNTRLLQLTIFLCFLFPSFSKSEELPDEVHRKIVDLYSSEKCEEVSKFAKTINVENLRANVIAIVAYCETNDSEAKKLFQLAEEKEPTRDLVLLLHGLYISKKYGEDEAKPFWEKILMYARVQYFRDIAKAHLAHAVDLTKSQKPLQLSPDTGFATIFLGGLYKSDARLQDTVYQDEKSSLGTKSRVRAGYRKWFPRGSLALNYSFDYDRMNSGHQYDFLDQNFEATYALHVTKNKDLSFKPLTSYTLYGSKPFSIKYGLGVKGSVYNDTFVQSVQTTTYSEKVFTPELSEQSGAHYRFDYLWEFYPKLWFISGSFFMDHVSSGRATRYVNKDGDFEMSYTLFGVNFIFEKNFGKFILGYDPSVSYRHDTKESVYLNSSGFRTAKLREEWCLSNTFVASIPVSQTFQIYTWYTITNTISNMDSSDYLNRNYDPQIIGLGVRASLATY